MRAGEPKDDRSDGGDGAIDGYALFDDPAAVDRLDMRGYQDITRGRLLGNEAVALWLGMWGKIDAESPPWR